MHLTHASQWRPVRSTPSPQGRKEAQIRNLAVVLEGLCAPPYEPLEEATVKYLILKTVFLLAMSSFRRFRDLQALSTLPSCLNFAPGRVKAFLHSWPGYVPKVASNTPDPVVLQAFCPPPIQDANQERVNLLCPMCILAAYVPAMHLLMSDQLFACFGVKASSFQRDNEQTGGRNHPAHI